MRSGPRCLFGWLVGGLLPAGLLLAFPVGVVVRFISFVDVNKALLSL